MNVLIVSPLPPPAGGIATWTVKYRKYCEEHGIGLSIVNSALVGSRAIQINSKRSYWDEIKRTIGVLRSMRANLKRERFDVIHVNTSCARFGIFRDGLCVAMAARRKIPVVLHCRCNIQDQISGRLAKRVFVRMVKQSSRTLVLNRKSYHYVASLTCGQVLVLPNFIEAHYINKAFVVKEHIRTVLFVGHVQRTKGVFEIIEAARELPDIRFKLIGPVHKEVAELTIPENVELLGNQPHEKVMEYLRDSDVFLFPSYTEGFANALAEAMASGLPVITTDVGANYEMIEEDGGVIVPVCDSGAIVKALEKMKDPELRRQMSGWNAAKVEHFYLQEAVMAKLITLYGEVMA